MSPIEPFTNSTFSAPVRQVAYGLYVAVAERVQRLFALVAATALVRAAVQSLISLVVVDKNSEQLLFEAKQKLAQDPVSDYYFAAAKVVGDYAVQFLLTAMAEKRPFPWMEKLVTPSGSYTFLGQTLLDGCTRHKALLSRCIELNLVKAFTSFAKTIREVDEKRSFVLLDFVKDGLKEARSHLDLDHEPSLKTEKELTSELITGAFQLFFPNGEKDLELAVWGPIAGRLRQFIYPFARDTLVPELVAEALEFAKHDYVKTHLAIQAIQAIKTPIETVSPTEPAQEVHAPKYPSQRKLTKRLKKCIDSGIDYLIPNTLPLALGAALPGILAKAGSDALTKGVLGRLLQDLVPIGIQLLLEAMTREGEWDGKGLRVKFSYSGFSFPEPPVAKELAETELKKKLLIEQERLKKLLETTGENLEGIKKIIEDAPILKSVRGNFTMFFSKHAVELAGARDIIKKLNASLAEKMLLPVHDRLIVVLLNGAIKHFKE